VPVLGRDEGCSLFHIENLIGGQMNATPPRLLPGQRPGETVQEYTQRIEARVDAPLRSDGQVPERFSRLNRAHALTVEHPIFRTTNHEYGSMIVTQYERPTICRTVSRQFTERPLCSDAV
jgi:hypothetical protein